jgi:predicted acylesterase/phospholipase RssA
MKSILVLDGGGIRGIFQILILQELCFLAHYSSITDLFDCIGGISVGGLIASALSHSYQPHTLHSHFPEWASHIFQRSWYHTIRSLNGWLQSKYTNVSYSSLLEQEFSSSTLQESKIPLCLFAYNLSHSSPHIFSSWEHPNLLYSDILLASTAAPSYFPAYMLQYDGDMYCDAGVACNTPCEWVLNHVRKTHPDFQSKDEPICIVSIGTGFSTYIEPSKPTSGMLQWIVPLTNLLFQANEELQLEELSDLLTPQDSIYRWNGTIPTDIPLDDVTQITTLEIYARKWIDEHKDEIKHVANLLLDRKNDF